MLNDPDPNFWYVWPREEESDEDIDEETSEEEVGNPRISEMILTAMCRKHRMSIALLHVVV